MPTEQSRIDSLLYNDDLSSFVQLQKITKALKICHRETPDPTAPIRAVRHLAAQQAERTVDLRRRTPPMLWNLRQRLELQMTVEGLEEEFRMTWFLDDRADATSHGLSVHQNIHFVWLTPGMTK